MTVPVPKGEIAAIPVNIVLTVVDASPAYLYPRLAELREDHDLSQAEMAKILRVSQATYSRYETGRLDIPSQTLIALARYYGVSVDYLLGLDHRR